MNFQQAALQNSAKAYYADNQPQPNLQDAPFLEKLSRLAQVMNEAGIDWITDDTFCQLLSEAVQNQGLREMLESETGLKFRPQPASSSSPLTLEDVLTKECQHPGGHQLECLHLLIMNKAGAPESGSQLKYHQAVSKLAQAIEQQQPAWKEYGQLGYNQDRLNQDRLILLQDTVQSMQQELQQGVQQRLPQSMQQQAVCTVSGALHAATQTLLAALTGEWGKQQAMLTTPEAQLVRRDMNALVDALIATATGLKDAGSALSDGHWDGIAEMALEKLENMTVQMLQGNSSGDAAEQPQLRMLVKQELQNLPLELDIVVSQLGEAVTSDTRRAMTEKLGQACAVAEKAATQADVLSNDIEYPTKYRPDAASGQALAGEIVGAVREAAAALSNAADVLKQSGKEVDPDSFIDTAKVAADWAKFIGSELKASVSEVLHENPYTNLQNGVGSLQNAARHIGQGLYDLAAGSVRSSKIQYNKAEHAIMRQFDSAPADTAEINVALRLALLPLQRAVQKMKIAASALLAPAANLKMAGKDANTAEGSAAPRVERSKDAGVQIQTMLKAVADTMLEQTKVSGKVSAMQVSGKIKSQDKLNEAALKARRAVSEVLQQIESKTLRREIKAILAQLPAHLQDKAKGRFQLLLAPLLQTAAELEKVAGKLSVAAEAAVKQPQQVKQLAELALKAQRRATAVKREIKLTEARLTGEVTHNTARNPMLAKGMAEKLHEIKNEFVQNNPDVNAQAIDRAMAGILKGFMQKDFSAENDPNGDVMLKMVALEISDALNGVTLWPDTPDEFMAKQTSFSRYAAEQGIDKLTFGLVSEFTLYGENAVRHLIDIDPLQNLIAERLPVIKAVMTLYSTMLGRATILKGVRPGQPLPQAQLDEFTKGQLKRLAFQIVKVFTPAVAHYAAAPFLIGNGLYHNNDLRQGLGVRILNKLPPGFAWTGYMAGQNQALGAAAKLLVGGLTVQQPQSADAASIAGIDALLQEGRSSLEAEMRADPEQDVQEEKVERRAGRNKRSFDYRLSLHRGDFSEYVGLEKLRLLQEDKNLTPVQIEAYVEDYKLAINNYRDLVKSGAPDYKLNSAKLNLFKATNTLEIVRNNLEQREISRSSLSEEAINKKGEDYLKSVKSGYNIRVGHELNPRQKAFNYLMDIIGRYDKSERGVIDSPDSKITLLNRASAKEETFTLFDIATGQVDPDSYLLPDSFIKHPPHENPPYSKAFLEELKLITDVNVKGRVKDYRTDALGGKSISAIYYGYQFESSGDQMLKSFENDLDELMNDTSKVNDMDNFYEANFKVTASTLAKNAGLKAFRADLEAFQYGKREAEHLDFRGSRLTDVVCFSVKDKILAIDVQGKFIVIENTPEGLKNVENQKWIVSHLSANKQFKYKITNGEGGYFKFIEHSTAPLERLGTSPTIVKKYATRQYSPLSTFQLKNTGKETFEVACQRARDDMNSMIKTSTERNYDIVIDYAAIAVGLAAGMGVGAAGLSPAILFMMQMGVSAGMTAAKELLKAALKDNQAEAEDVLKALPVNILAGMMTDSGVTVGTKLAGKLTKAANIKAIFQTPAQQMGKDIALNYVAYETSNRVASLLSSNADTGNEDVNTSPRQGITSLPEMQTTDVLDTTPKGIVVGELYCVIKDADLFDICRDLDIPITDFQHIHLKNEALISDVMNIKVGTFLRIPESVMEKTRFSAPKGEDIAPGEISGNEYVVYTNTNVNAICRNLGIGPQYFNAIYLANKDNIDDPNNIPRNTRLKIPEDMQKQYNLYAKKMVGQMYGKKFNVSKSADKVDIYKDLKLTIEPGISLGEQIKRQNLVKQLLDANPWLRKQDLIKAGTQLTLPPDVLEHYQQLSGQRSVVNSETVPQNNREPQSLQLNARFGQVKGNEFITLKAAKADDIYSELNLSLADKNLPLAEKMARSRLSKQLDVANPSLQAKGVIEAGTKLILPPALVLHYQQQSAENSASNAEAAPQQSVSPLVVENQNNPPKPQPPLIITAYDNKIEGNKYTAVEGLMADDIRYELYLSHDKDFPPSEFKERDRLYQLLLKANPSFDPQFAVWSLTLPPEVLQHYLQQSDES